MSDQHLVESFIDKGARSTAAVRFTRKSALLIALCMFAVGGAAVHYAPSIQTGGADQADASQVSEADSAEEAASEAAPFAQAPVARRTPSLSREQQNVARFIASRYRLAMDQTQQFVEFAYRTARDAKVDPWLILAVISVESAFDPSAQSTRGAQGLMQVLTRVHADKFAPFGGVTAAFDPLANIRVGVQILKGYLMRDGSVEAALKAYVGAATLPHDSGYGEKVLTERERIAEAASGRQDPARLAQDAGRADRTLAAPDARASRRGRASVEDPPFELPDTPIRESVEIDHARDRAGLVTPATSDQGS